MRQVLVYKLNKTRLGGRQCQHWLDRVKGDLCEAEETARIIEDVHNRDVCRKLMEAANDLNGL